MTEGSQPPMRAPERYVAWINAHLGFNPRAQQSSDALSSFVVDDLVAVCPPLAADLSEGRVRRKLNASVGTRITERNVDLVLADTAATGILGVVRLAVENKTVMTAHGKARKNRYGDLIAFANHLHNHSPRAVAGAIVCINASAGYRNPDPFAISITRRYPNIAKIVADTVSLFSGIPLRNRVDEPNDQPEAIAVVVVDYDGVNPARLIVDPPAPQPGEDAYYDAFVQRLSRLYEERFSVSSKSTS